MITLGVKRKDLESGFYGCAPCCESDPQKKTDWENTVVHPELRVEGRHAELLGVDDLKLGDRIRFEVVAEVCGMRKEDRLVDGKPKRDLSLTLKLVSASDMVEEAAEGGEEGEESPRGAGDEALEAILPGK